MSRSSLSKPKSLALTLNLLRPHIFRRTFSSPSDHDLTDLPESPSSSDPLLRNLEDAIQRILVRRSAPDWLPFVPGASYWVPLPSNSHLPPIASVLRNLANPLSHEQSLSTTTVRGWPSSHYFIQGIPLLSYFVFILSLFYLSLSLFLNYLFRKKNTLSS